MEFQLSRLNRSEWMGMASALLLAISLFLPWFTTDEGNENSKIQGLRNPDGGLESGAFNAFQTFYGLEWFLLAACAAPFILAWMVARGHQVGWNRGEITAIVGFIAMMLVLLNGLVLGQPGTVDTSLSWGYLVAIVATIGILMSGALRQQVGQKPTPPGV